MNRYDVSLWCIGLISDQAAIGASMTIARRPWPRPPKNTAHASSPIGPATSIRSSGAQKTALVPSPSPRTATAECEK